LEKDRDGCPKIVNLGASRTDLFYERRRLGAFVPHAPCMSDRLFFSSRLQEGLADAVTSSEIMLYYVVHAIQILTKYDGYKLSS
jgi:hypothetical protein